MTLQAKRPISGSGTLQIKEAAGANVTGAVSFATSLTLILGHQNALGTGAVTWSGTPFTLQASTDLTGASAIANTFTLSNNSGASGGYTFSGNSSLEFTGAVSVSNTNNNQKIINNIAAGKTLTFKDFALNANAGATFTTFFYGSGATVIAGTVSNGGGTTRNLTYNGTGSLTLSGSNTYSGVTTVGNGILQLAKTNALYNNTPASWTAANIVVNSGATLALNVGGTGEFSTANVTTLITNLDRAVTNNVLRSGSKIAFDTTNAGGSFTVADSIQNTTGTGGGAVGLTKLGTGTLTLTGTNTYTGATTVSAGTLVVNGSISTSSLTTVASGATLGGSGTVGKTVINSGGTLAVGTSPGQMTFTDTLGLSGTTVMEIDGTAGAGVTGGHDVIKLTGSGGSGLLTYGGTMTLDIGAIFGVGTYSWDLFDFASETSGFSSITLDDQYSGTLTTDGGGIWGLTSGFNTWSFTQSSGVLGLTVVPEPGAALLGGLGMLVLLRRRR